MAQRAGGVFPGPDLVPREYATFLDALLTRANPASRTEDSSDGWRAPGVPMYEIALGVLGGDAPNVVVDGYIGRAAFDATFGVGPDEADCAPTAQYCAFTPYVAGPPIAERIAGLKVGELAAVARHLTCCNGETW